ncbi:flagellar hook-length control protein FliK [Hoeflea ulvae]|uniref:Flagellar hook-length control protein FliK n=1 Tax=Hoeflea ulvae TaxID=2983764 RepID=A0ABT3YCW2_9HYPH|nr:flagellar hook-length control protein FliK [Hoeflea ulvae]MCY0093527.1 flagellar hook-length control protein FliK [Hoeflea ulvae]
MQRQVPARAPVSSGDTHAADPGGASKGGAFSAILSGEQRGAAGNRGRLDTSSRTDAEADTGATAAETQIDAEVEAVDSQLPSVTAETDDMLTLLSGLMSSAAFAEEPAETVVDENLTAADVLAAAELAPAELPKVEPDQVDAKSVLEGEMEIDPEAGEELQLQPDAEPVAQAATQPVAPQPAAVAATAAAPVAALAASVAQPAPGNGVAQPAAARTPSSEGAADKQKKADASREALGALGLSSDAASTAETRSARNEGLSNAAAERKSAGADRQPEEKIEAKPRTVEVVESRRFTPSTQLSGNAQMLTSSLAEAGDTALAAQRVARTSSAAAAGTAQTGQTLHTLKLQLNPMSLGSVTAIMKLSGEELSVELKVESAEAYRQLSDDSQSIVKSLRAQGYAVEQITIQHVSNPDKTANQSAQPGFSGGFQGNEPGDAKSSGGNSSGSNTSQRDQQGRQGHEGNTIAGSGTGRTDGVYL